MYCRHPVLLDLYDSKPIMTPTQRDRSGSSTPGGIPFPDTQSHYQHHQPIQAATAPQEEESAEPPEDFLLLQMSGTLSVMCSLWRGCLFF